MVNGKNIMERTSHPRPPHPLCFESFLGYVDLLGTTYQSPAIATGYGAYIAIPLLRKAVENGGEDILTEADARKVMEDCLRVLYYRDSSSMNKVCRNYRES